MEDTTASMREQGGRGRGSVREQGGAGIWEQGAGVRGSKGGWREGARGLKG